MPRKVILDVDPGIDDAVALALALFDPRLEVEAVTAVAGNVGPDRATRNVQAIVEQLDPPRLPRIGSASEPDHGVTVDRRQLHGADGLANTNFEVAELHHVHPSDKLIADVIKTYPADVTVVCLGPLTNVARALRRMPDLPEQIDSLLIMGGTLGCAGNVTAAADFNMYFDPESAREVFRTPCVKTLVPYDITSQVLLTYDLLDQLPPEVTRVGRLLRRILPHAYRAHHQILGFEGVHVHDAVALMALTDPELFSATPMYGDIETRGELTMGATIFDRRRNSEARPNLNLVTECDATAIRERLTKRLMQLREA
ncbi:MAG: nucleoside hydrolase [Pirellulales bacterium]